MSDFKMIEFDCKLKMQVAITDDMTEEEIIEKIEESFDFFTECASPECDFSDEYSAYMTYENMLNLKVLDE